MARKEMIVTVLCRVAVRLQHTERSGRGFAVRTLRIHPKTNAFLPPQSNCSRGQQNRVFAGWSLIFVICNLRGKKGQRLRTRLKGLSVMCLHIPEAS